MRKVFVALAALLLSVPTLAATVHAQTPPHVFVGEATLDGTPVPDGTLVRALFDGVPIPRAETTVIEGKYTLFVDQPPSPAVIGFAIGDFVAEQTAQWETGGATAVNLAATSQLPSVQLGINPLPPEQVVPGDQFALKVNANTGFNKAISGEFSVNYDPSVFHIERDRSSLHQGPNWQKEPNPGLYQSNWEYLTPTSTASFSGELEGIFFTVRDDAPAASTAITIQAHLYGEGGQEYQLEPEVVTYRINVAGLSGDFNEDKVVDIVDLAALGAVWGLQAGQAGFDHSFDIDNDGLIGVGDLVSLLQSYRTFD